MRTRLSCRSLLDSCGHLVKMKYNFQPLARTLPLPKPTTNNWSKIKSSVNLSYSDQLSSQSPLMFSSDLLLEGSPILWDKLHWLKAPLMDPSQEIIFRKGSQMGVSTYCIIWALWLCKTRQAPRGLIYWLPTDAAVGDFVNTKLDPFINENPELYLAKQTNVKRIKSADNQGLKFMYNVPTFWRGLKSKTSVKSISADAAVYDEFDEAEPAQVVQARKRLSASNVKLTRDLSTPTIPDFGIDKRFQESDQCHYGFRCGHCSTWNILEENWPNVFKQDREGSYYHACRHCSGRLDVSQGHWIRKNQSSRLRGYQISQLYSPFVSPNEIMREYQSTEFMGHFHNHVLGLPYISASDMVTSEMVLQLCDPMASMSSGTMAQTVMGVDVGSKLHVTILLPKPPYKVIHVGEYRDFEELTTLMLKFNVKECVIDALPETRKVREFIAKNPRKVWACFYNDNQKGNYAWKEDERIVMVNRTESLDAGTNRIIEKQLILPQRSPMIELFAQHAANIVKVAEENKDTGERKFVYRKLAADHFRHSLNYAMIAASRVRSGSVISIYR